MAKRKAFTVTAQINVTTDTVVHGASFEEALAEARKLAVGDFITIEGAHIDSNLKIDGIYEGE